MAKTFWPRRKWWPRRPPIVFVDVQESSGNTKKQGSNFTAKNFMNKGNTLIHCTHGADRTGAIAGRWMVEKYGISAKEAYKDALKHGFKPYMYTYPSKPNKPDANRALRYFIFTGEGARWSTFKTKQPEFFKER